MALAASAQLSAPTPRVTKVSFTGIAVYASAAKKLKPVALELGGKSPLIVLPDADLKAAIDACITANFHSSGRVCTNGTRVFIHANVFDHFSKLLVQKVGGARAW